MMKPADHKTTYFLTGCGINLNEMSERALWEFKINFTGYFVEANILIMHTI